MDKEQFLKEFGKDYGYSDGPKVIDEIRATEFKRLANGKTTLIFQKYKAFKEPFAKSYSIWIKSLTHYLDYL